MPYKHRAFLTTFSNLSSVAVHVPDPAPLFFGQSTAAGDTIELKRQSSLLAHLYVQIHFTLMGLK